MKKLTFSLVMAILLLALVFSLVACGEDNNAKDNGISSLIGGNTNQNKDINAKTLYAYAQDAGYTGTMEELLEAFKGDSAYTIAKENGYLGTEVEWLSSIKGAAGENGLSPYIGENGNWWIGNSDAGIAATGKNGNGIDKIEGKKSVADTKVNMYTVYFTNGTSIDFNISDGTNGNGITNVEKTSSQGLLDTYTITFTDGTTIAFNVTNGKSAYEIAVDNGYSGTVTEWLTSLVGECGTNGKSAYEIAKENGFEGTVSEWLTSLVGEIGAVGETGETGAAGNGVASIEKTATEGLTDTYTITFTDGTTTSFTVTNGNDATAEEQLLYYKATDGYVVRGIGNVSEVDLIIPDFYKDLPVVGIMTNAFVNCPWLTSITIPDSVTNIGSFAFSGCSAEIKWDNNPSIKAIGENTFSGYKGTAITTPNNVTSIGESAFEDCSNLTSITIPDSVTSIGCAAFWGCNSLTSITIPDSVTSIGEYVFYNCSSLTSITIPDSVTSIGEYVFYYCSSLTSITIPDSVTSIGEYAFYNCTNLARITIGDRVASIGVYAFKYCYKIVEIYNKSALTIIAGSYSYGYVGCYARNVCTNENDSKFSTNADGYQIYADGEDIVLVGYIGNEAELTIPETITEINQFAFYNDNNVTSITIGNAVTSIGYNAFNN